jgi:hypothetical protein
MSDLTKVADLAHATEAAHDPAIIVGSCIMVLILCFVAAVYSDSANIAPPDPVAIGFYP